MYNKSFDISHIHIGCNIFEIFATLRYATSCQRFAVCFTVFMRCHVNQLKCVVASAIPHSLVYFSGFFSRHSSFLPLPPPPHIHIYMFYNFVLFSFVCVCVLSQSTFTSVEWKIKCFVLCMIYVSPYYSHHQQHYQKKKTTKNLQHSCRLCVWCLLLESTKSSLWNEFFFGGWGRD